MLGSQLAKVVGGQLVGEDFYFSRIAFNSSDCDTDTLFVALPGAKTHGIKFWADAQAKGATGALTDVSPSTGSYVLVKDSLQAMELLGKSLVSGYKGKIVVVLGASGKTTLKELLRALAPVPVWSSYGNRNTMISLITDLYNEGNNALDLPYWILEFGIHEPKDANEFLSVFDPYAVIFTSLGAEHLEYLTDTDTAIKTNLMIGEHAKKRFAYAPEGYSVNDAVIFGGNDSPYRFDVKSFTCDGCTVGELICGEAKKHFVLPFWGKRSSQSVAGAAAFWQSEGFSLESLPWQNIESINIWGRQQLTRWNDLLIFFDAYNANPESMKEFLDVVKEVPYARKGLVIGDMLELGSYSAYWHKQLAHWLKNSGVQYLVLVGDEVRYTLQELNKIDGQPIYVEWYRDVDTAKAFFLVPDDLELLGLKGSRRIALEKLIQEGSEIES
jgi:UDP-N-acetylmuramoyl-tripeptide--D-alanyl-D-alanine ligase